jgi:hypothetical protein
VPFAAAAVVDVSLGAVSCNGKEYESCCLSGGYGDANPSTGVVIPPEAAELRSEHTESECATGGVAVVVVVVVVFAVVVTLGIDSKGDEFEKWLAWLLSLVTLLAKRSHELVPVASSVVDGVAASGNGGPNVDID